MAAIWANNPGCFGWACATWVGCWYCGAGAWDVVLAGAADLKFNFNIKHNIQIIYIIQKCILGI